MSNFSTTGGTSQTQGIIYPIALEGSTGLQLGSVIPPSISQAITGALGWTGSAATGLNGLTQITILQEQVNFLMSLVKNQQLAQP